MKSKGVVALLTLLFFAACQEKDMYVPATSGVGDLVVPAGFTWNLSKDVALGIESSKQSSVDVFLSADCADDKLVATLQVPTEEDVTLNIPTGVENLYIRYMKTDGSYGKEVVSLNDAVTRAEDNRKVKLPEDIKMQNKQGVIYMPDKGWGTLLFEDMWPAKGDYDFNDFAAWYKIQLYTEGKKSKYTDAILVSVRLNAMGGYLPYHLCLRMDELKSEEIAEIQPYETPSETGSFKLVTTGKDRAVFVFDWPNLRGSNGGRFYNTEQQYKVSSADLDKNVVSFMIYLDEGKKTETNFQSESFNFFLQKEGDGKEIHMMGYAPTPDFENEYDKISKDNSKILDLNYYYRTNDGFVWGLKVPDAISHAKEGVDFCKAYKKFGEWVTSGGTDKKEWYRNDDSKDRENLIQVSTK